MSEDPAVYTTTRRMKSAVAELKDVMVAQLLADQLDGKTRRCLRCGRKLTAVQSAAGSLGPDCATRVAKVMRRGTARKLIEKPTRKNTVRPKRVSHPKTLLSLVQILNRIRHIFDEEDEGGFRYLVSKDDVKHWADEGLFPKPVIRQGNKYLWDRAAVDRWIAHRPAKCIPSQKVKMATYVTRVDGD